MAHSDDMIWVNYSSGTEAWLNSHVPSQDGTSSIDFSLSEKLKVKLNICIILCSGVMKGSF